MDSKGAHLILIMGLPGTGKTYVARALAERLRVQHYNSDRIRKEQSARPGYSAGDKAMVYQEMFQRVTENLENDRTVIVDATFSKAIYRQPYLDWAEAHQVPIHLLLMEAAETTIRERVSKKRPDSDADFKVYLKIKAEYEIIEQEHLRLRSDEGTLEAQLDKAMTYIGRIAKQS